MADIPQANTASAEDIAKAVPVNQGIFGQTIPRLFGGSQIKCAPVWAAPVQTNNDGSRLVTYAAIAGMRSPFVDSVQLLRVWMDGIVAYDNSGASGSQQALNFRFYDGSEFQLPDPAIVAQEGADATPAFRDRMYIVIENWKVDIGANFPEVVVEIVQISNPTNTRYCVPYAAGNTGEVDEMLLSYPNDMLVLRQGTNCHVYNTLSQSLESSWPILGAVQAVSNTDGGFIYAAEYHKLHLYSRSGVLLFTFNSDNIGPGNGFGATSLGYGDKNADEYILISGYFQHYVLLKRNGNVLSLVQDTTLPYGGITGPRQQVFADVRQYSPNSDYRLAYCFNDRGTIAVLFDTNAATAKLVAGGDDNVPAFTTPIDRQGTGRYVLVGMIDPQAAKWLATVELMPDGTRVYCRYSTVFDAIAKGTPHPTPDTLVLRYTSVLPADFPNQVSYQEAAAKQSTQPGQTQLAFATATGSLYVLDMYDGTFTLHPPGVFVVVDHPELSFGNAGGFNADPFNIYDSDKEALYYRGLSPQYRPGKLYLYDQADGAGSMLLSTFMRGLASLAGFPDENIITDGIDDALDGAIINQPTSIMDIAAAMSQLFRFDFYETGDGIKFRRKNRSGGFAVDRTLTDADLVFLDQSTDGDGFFEKTRTPTANLPQRITTTYLDGDNDFQLGAQTAKRTVYPARASNGTNDATVGVPVAMSAGTALYWTEVYLFDTWAEALTLKFRVTVGNVDLEPGDYVQLTTLNYGSYTVRLTEVYLNTDKSVTCTGVSVLSIAPANNRINPIDVASPDKPTLPGFGDSNFGWYVIDNIALLSATDGMPGAVAYLSVFANARITVKATLPDGSTTYGVCFDAVSRGILVAVPPAKDHVEVPSNAVFNVRLLDGIAPVTATDDDFLAGNSAMLVGNTGRWELIYFRDVTANGDGSYAITHLLRGRRGSDTVAELNSSDIVLFIGAAKPAAVQYVPSMAPESITLAAVLSGQDFTYGQVQNKSLIVNSGWLKPWAPVQLSAAHSGGDVVLNWVRRDRADSDVHDGDDNTPLAESMEVYDVDILAPDGTVKRSVHNVTAPTYTYTAAQIAADALDVSSSITFAVYQLSATVGRGYGRTATCRVN